MAIDQTLDSNDVQERKFKIVIVGNVESADYLAKVVIFTQIFIAEIQSNSSYLFAKHNYPDWPTLTEIISFFVIFAGLFFRETKRYNVPSLRKNINSKIVGKKLWLICDSLPFYAHVHTCSPSYADEE